MADIKKRIALRSREEGVHKSLQSLLEASSKAQSRAEQQRREGEGLRGYVRRVSAGSLTVVDSRMLSELRRQIEVLMNRQQVSNLPRVQTVRPGARNLVAVGGPCHGRVVQLDSGVHELRLSVAPALRAGDVRPDSLSSPHTQVITHLYYTRFVDNVEALFHNSLLPVDSHIGLGVYAVARREMRNAYHRAGEPFPGGN